MSETGGWENTEELENEENNIYKRDRSRSRSRSVTKSPIKTTIKLFIGNLP